MIQIILSAVATWVVYHKTNKWAPALVAGLATLLTLRIFLPASENFGAYGANHACADFKGSEKFPRQRSPSMQFGPLAPLFSAHPPPHQSVEETEQGDNTLTNLYRRLHNLDAIQRTEIFQFHNGLAGGSYGIPRQPYIGEANDRAMMDLNQQIRDEISARRRPYSEAYDVPTKPLMGDFYNCGLGDCQVQADKEGHILGLPSQVGITPGYF
jgi:hypothetical protein